jgi:VanZ family protein
VCLSLAGLLSTNTEAKSSVILWQISALVWAAFIFYFSTATFGEGTSQWLLTRALAFVHLMLSPASFDTMHDACRKLAHLTEYGIFGLLLYRCLPAACGLGGERQRAFLCVLAAAAYSLTDEFHQLFVPGRHASVADCAIDSAGAALTVLLAFGYRRLVSYREEETGGLA